jgi:hypothetical protein
MRPSIHGSRDGSMPTATARQSGRRERERERAAAVATSAYVPPDVEGAGDARRAVAAEDAGADALGRAARRALRLGVPDPVRLALPPAAVRARQRRREVAQRRRRGRRSSGGRHRQRRRQRDHRRRLQQPQPQPQDAAAGPIASWPAGQLGRPAAAGGLRRRPHLLDGRTLPRQERRRWELLPAAEEAETASRGAR